MRLLMFCALNIKRLPVPFFSSQGSFADQHATWIPKILRQPSTESLQPDPEPHVKELVRVGIDTLFTSHPVAVSVSRAVSGAAICSAFRF